ncbi:hypothetical protein COV16_02425 [Candidatus Woesearchaeota archaeon CG10_big_fil_rev_8_21_14_0_10_34_8]|nr:MAG: hypothetical protein COV16_02425 [Candidatus Woesearchaeota archaeon CG10_big_fil_rev_8_21_14_0_10_34_8]
MRKIFVLMFVLLLVSAVASCRDNGSSTATDTKDKGTSTSDDEGMDTGNDDNMEVNDDTDPNENDPVFEQTGKHEESVTITKGEKAPTVVVDLGELVTLEVYSEYLKDVHLYNEDLYVDSTISRADTEKLIIEANEEGIFSIIDKDTGDQVIKFIVAGVSFG